MSEEAFIELDDIPQDDVIYTLINFHLGWESENGVSNGHTCEYF